MNLGSLLDASGATVKQVVERLEGLGEVELRADCLALEPASQRRLWELAMAAPPAAGVLVTLTGTATFAGRNSLSAFSRFEKRFSRQGETVVGYNIHPFSPVIGPGYFTLIEGAGEGLVFDYRQVPSIAPSGWPRLRSNSGFLARSVYGDLLDRVRWIGRDVLIGAAFRRGESLNSYLVLVRAAS